MSLLKDLNPVQQKAVLETEGPLLVFAGAGSGKTRVLTYRIAYLIQEKLVSPWNIFAVTFTNKAADEMRERVEKLLGSSAKGTWISTFHSACARILRQHIEHLGFQRNFVIYDEQDQERHLKAVMKELDLDFRMFHPRAVQSKIESLKNEGITPEQYLPDPYNIFQKRVALVYQKYQEDLRRNNGLDFGDLLTFVAILFNRFPEVLRHYQEHCRYVLVDEFQDTNLIQYQLIQRMVERHQNICVVGDDDQSIYRWRGAEVGNILNFEKDFPKAKVITLEQNYRSTQNILQAANSMVRKNRSRKEKVLWTENSEGELITLYAAEDEADEARFVVQKIMEQCSSSSPIGFSGGSGRPYRDIAVFYRINAQSRAIEDELVKHQIPYTIVGGLKFYERKEIKDILAYLKLIANPSDGLSLKRIINVPSRGIGEKTIEKIEIFSKEKGIPLYEGMKQALNGGVLSPVSQEKIEEFIHLIEEFREETRTLSLSQLTLALLAKTGYLNRLKEEGTEEAFSRIENIDELINVMMEFEQGGEEVSLESFLDKVSLVADVDLYEDKGNRVSLMTLHCAKGLEFPFVFIVGMEEGLLPHYRRGDEIEDLEEERRLCYVGITRTKERVFLSRAEKRSTFGVGRANLPSRFLEELPIELIQLEERQGKMETLFSQETSMADQLTDWKDHFQQPEKTMEDLTQENFFPERQEMVLSPVDETRLREEFFPLRVGMKVRHPKFGEGRVRSIEGMNEDQKATILFQSVGSKRLKVRYAQLEILE
ncbi:MAG: ATP-dependent DNA helicase PcrA [Deltaproteobacteria bacterium RBG_13_47_9]|nr:MAG: ATP-dependent DNA helicase PcrA [Deltaproteobacteria bacterium RBG_13_47_9]